MRFTLSIGPTNFKIHGDVMPEKFRGYIGVIKRMSEHSIRFDYTDENGVTSELGVDPQAVDLLYPDRKGSDPIWSPFG